MSNTDILSRLEQIVAPPVAAQGLFLEGVVMSGPPNRRVVRITVDLPDGPGGVGSDALEGLTRTVSDLLDETDPLPGGYQLEVTTPGVDRPLTTARHYRRNLGRLVKITTESDSGPRTVTGRVSSADDAAVTLETDSGPQTFDRADISQANVELEFRPRAKGAPHGN